MSWLYKVVAEDFTILCNKGSWVELNREGAEVDKGGWEEKGMDEYISHVSSLGYEYKVIKLPLKLENK